MKSKLLFLICLTALMVLSLGSAAAYASADLTVSSDKTLTSKFNVYDNVTVKSGATLSMAKRTGDPTGLEIKKSLVVEKGAKLAGDGILIFHRGAVYSGITLYYQFKGEIMPIPAGFDLNVIISNEDYRPNFRYNEKKGIYILEAEFRDSDPFELRMSENFLDMVKGDTYQLSLSGVTEGVKWSSGKKSVATVSKTGIVTAKKEGQTVITAEFNGKKYECQVSVSKPGLSAKELHMDEGSVFYIQLNGTSVKSAVSSDKSVAGISKKLKITAKSEGDCTITVKGKNGKKYKCIIHVHRRNEDM